MLDFKPGDSDKRKSRDSLYLFAAVTTNRKTNRPISYRCLDQYIILYESFT